MNLPSDMTPSQAFEAVNQLLPAAKESMRVAYITAGSLLAFVGALICHTFGCRRAAATCNVLVGVGLGFWTPAGLAPILGVVVVITSALTIWRETKHRKEPTRA